MMQQEESLHGCALPQQLLVDPRVHALLPPTRVRSTSDLPDDKYLSSHRQVRYRHVKHLTSDSIVHQIDSIPVLPLQNLREVLLVRPLVLHYPVCPQTSQQLSLLPASASGDDVLARDLRQLDRKLTRATRRSGHQDGFPTLQARHLQGDASCETRGEQRNHFFGGLRDSKAPRSLLYPIFREAPVLEGGDRRSKLHFDAFSFLNHHSNTFKPSAKR
mmetsp:Transcript_8340/g.28614  ORF Transcript_8340/g.28614 Transcript_8340/m.28614 type:complete len:217 (+) Transcript_8340:2944-3594(+)